MKDWQERVVVEKNELDKKLGKLDAFINSNAFAELPEQDQKILKDQQFHMSCYSSTLAHRIGRFKD